MASPQLENGHISIANEIIECFSKTQMSGYEYRILWVIIRETWGYAAMKNGKVLRDENNQIVKKQRARIPLLKFVKNTGIAKSHVCRTLTILEFRNIITKNGNEFGEIEYSFQKDYDQWLEPISDCFVTKNGNAYFVTKNGNLFSKVGNEITELGNKVSKNGNLTWSKLLKNKRKRNAKEILKETNKEIYKEKESTKKSSDELSDAAFSKEVIDRLNNKSNRNYRLIDSHKKFIMARKKEGFTLQDFFAVIDFKCSVWNDDKKMKQYLRPQTLFSPGKFDSYLQDSRDSGLLPKTTDQLLTNIMSQQRIAPSEREKQGFAPFEFDVSFERCTFANILKFRTEKNFTDDQFRIYVKALIKEHYRKQDEHNVSEEMAQELLAVWRKECPE